VATFYLKCVCKAPWIQSKWQREFGPCNGSTQDTKVEVSDALSDRLPACTDRFFLLLEPLTCVCDPAVMPAKIHCPYTVTLLISFSSYCFVHQDTDQLLLTDLFNDVFTTSGVHCSEHPFCGLFAYGTA
jgi:hypothetical protein